MRTLSKVSHNYSLKRWTKVPHLNSKQKHLFMLLPLKTFSDYLCTCTYWDFSFVFYFRTFFIEMSRTVLTCIYKNGTHTSLENCINPHTWTELALLYFVFILFICLLRLYCRSPPVPNSDNSEEPFHPSNQRVNRHFSQHLTHPSVYTNTIV